MWTTLSRRWCMHLTLKPSAFWNLLFFDKLMRFTLNSRKVWQHWECDNGQVIYYTFHNDFPLYNIFDSERYAFEMIFLSVSSKHSFIAREGRVGGIKLSSVQYVLMQTMQIFAIAVIQNSSKSIFVFESIYNHSSEFVLLLTKLSQDNRSDPF